MNDVVIGNNVKIQNNVSVYTGVELEDDVFCGPSCVFTNVSNPRSQIVRHHLYERTLSRRAGCVSDGVLASEGGGKMLALRGICEGGKIELLDPVPRDLRSLVAVVFLDVEQEQVEEAREAMLLARSPTFRRLVERGLAEVERGNTRPVGELLDELPD
jgi:hypothetical protein